MSTKTIYGIQVSAANQPELDPEFISMTAFTAAFEKSAANGRPVVIALERENGQVARYETKIHGTPDFHEADRVYIERTLKMLIWAAGGFKVFIGGDDAVQEIGKEIAAVYKKGGEREFDADFMARVYENKFEVVVLPFDKAPKEVSRPKKIGGNEKGCRIGFDAGGSDRKVSAVVDGEAVYDEEVLWLPKENTDPDYHYNEILTAFRTAAAKLPRVDAIGVSSAGIYVGNRAMVASLFIKVPLDLFDKKVKNIYIRAAAEISKEVGHDLPLVVVNDGDVTALAGAMTIGDNEVLGIAMGTSEAVGYVNHDGNITGWLNELSFAPIDIGADKAFDDWSGDKGTGNKYFSQDAVIRLAEKQGIKFTSDQTLAKRLKQVQGLCEEGDPTAEAVFRTIGCYLAHALAYYTKFYQIRHILLLGRVMSGKGGDILLDVAGKVLKEEYPEVNKQISIDLPDEKFRRLGQSVVAASL
ncbi:hypothetical protein FACS189499_05640 [Clostridia bacterium]|nr:hypothetical protein FACS189499_05640 [Clostridia bacterium]